MDLAIKSRWELPVIEPKPAPFNERMDELIRDGLNLRTWDWLPTDKDKLTEFATDLVHACLTGTDMERKANSYALCERYVEAWAEGEANE